MLSLRVLESSGGSREPHEETISIRRNDGLCCNGSFGSDMKYHGWNYVNFEGNARRICWWIGCAQWHMRQKEKWEWIYFLATYKGQLGLGEKMRSLVQGRKIKLLWCILDIIIRSIFLGKSILWASKWWDISWRNLCQDNESFLSVLNNRVKN